ncbi:MAG: pseudouridine synthase [Clostridiales bacterium]|nr:pseudouridine synthase [Clostridiales bacterium]
MKENEIPAEGIRINKYLSEAGVCSRRAADREIEAGNVRIGDRVAVCGDRVVPGMQVYFRGEPVQTQEKEILIAFHKPVGIVCTAEKREKDNIIDYINYPVRIYPVGRLDKNSEGLILLTNQGDLVNRVMRAGNFHEKEYVVTVDHDITDEFLEGMRSGVYLEELGVKTRRCMVEQKNRRTFSMVLTQGYNRQIRRMCEAFGYRVRRLVRVRIMNIRLGDLAPGTYRDVTEAEKRELYRLIRDSYSAPRTGGRRGTA